MTDKQPPEALRQAAWLKKEGASCQRHYDLGVLIERQHAELETLRAKLKTYEGLGGAADDMQLLRMGYAAAQAAPAAMYSDLRARCLELLNWHRTGVLSGKALRAMARRKYGDDPNAIQRAERDTETEALNLVAAAPTTQPASQADSQPAPVSANHADLPPLPDPDTRDVGTAPGGIKEFLRGYATEYAKAAIAARKQGATHD